MNPGLTDANLKDDGEEKVNATDSPTVSLTRVQTSNSSNSLSTRYDRGVSSSQRHVDAVELLLNLNISHQWAFYFAIAIS
jgi:hypothetical protein